MTITVSQPRLYTPEERKYYVVVEKNPLPDWDYMREVTIDNTQNSNTLSDFQVQITLDTASLISNGKMKSDCGDIRVYDPNTDSLLPYWVETGTENTSSTRIWVKVPSIPGGGKKTIYLFYGNPGATSQSNGDDVFEVYEDAESYPEGQENPDDWSISETYGFNAGYWVKATSTSYGGVDYGSRTVEVGGSRSDGSYEDVYVYAQKPVSINAGDYKVEADIFFHYRNYDGKHGAKLQFGDVVVYQGNPFSGTGEINDWYHLSKTFTLSSDASTMKFGAYFNNLFSGDVYVALDKMFVRKYADPEPTTSVGVEQPGGDIKMKVERSW